MRRTLLLAVGLLILAAPAAAADPATLTVTDRVELGALSKATWDNGVRWGQVAITSDGHVLAFYCTDKRKIVFRHTADGKTFDEPVVVGSGKCPAVTVDADDNVHVVYIGAGNRPTLKTLKRSAGAKWTVPAKAAQPFKRFGAGPSNFPSVLIAPGSKRLWCMLNYQTVEIFSLPKTAWYPRRKPRGQAVVSYSDDGGASWAEPVYLGSDSGDEGSGVAVLRAWGGRAAWFWTFWDCATPAWGFFDGSRCRSMREFFPHARARMAVGHPWDTATDPAGRLIFATGMGSYTNGQVIKVLDGSGWSKERWLTDTRGPVSLIGDAERTFLVANEGGRLSASEIIDGQASRRGRLYAPPEGRTIFRSLGLPAGARPKGYLPLFVVEARGKKVGKRTRLSDYRLISCRLETRPLDDAASAAAKVTFDPAKTRNPKAYKHSPVGDDRLEPRTDAPKDRKLIRVGKRWIVVYADDNPGRLVAAPITTGTTGKPVVLIDKPQWGRFHCAATADGEDGFVAVAGGLDGVHFVRVTGAADWKLKTTVKTVLPAGGTTSWPTICRLSGGKLMIVAESGGKLVTTVSTDGGANWKALPAIATDAIHPRPALVAAGETPVLLVGGDNGLRARPWADGKWSDAYVIAKDPWVGHHFSAATDGDRIDVIYSRSASHLGKPGIGHVRLDNGHWLPMPDVAAAGVVRGLSVCDVGDGKLLAVYCTRTPRPATAREGVEKMKRFRYALQRKTFDGKAWPAKPAKLAWPELKTYKPANWTDWHEVGGVIYIPEVDLGRFPTLPAAAAKAIPAAWMVPGFLCMPKKNRVAPDRGGLLVVNEVKVRD